MMTRNDKLMTMKGADLIALADRLGVKVACNKARTALKESKQAVIDRIILAEELRAEAQKVATAEPTLSIPMPMESGENGPQMIEKAEPKIEKRSRKIRTFEALVANIPLVADIQLVANSKRNAVHVKRGSKRLFGYNGTCLVTSYEPVGVKSEKKSYGYRIEPTVENMMALLK